MTAGGERAPEWAVVGGGLLGMTLAHRLAARARRVTIYESGPTPGGLAAPWELGGVRWDRHYHVVLPSDSHLIALLHELGLGNRLVWKRTRTAFLTGGALYPLCSSLDYLRFPPLGWLAKLRLALTILYSARIRDGRRLEQVPVAQWLQRWSGHEAFSRIWLPLLRAKLGDEYVQASAAFIWATIRRMYSARRSGMKREQMGYISGGYAPVLERFEQNLAERGVEVLCSTPVRTVTEEGGGIVVDTSALSRRRFDAAVVTVPCPAAIRLCPQLSAGERDRLRRVRYLGIVCASVLLSRPLGGYYVTNITDGWLPFTAIIEMSALVDPRELAGRHLIYLPKYVVPEDPLFEVPDAGIEESFLAALRRVYPDLTPAQVVAFRVSRVRHVFALTTLRYSETILPFRTTVPNLYIVNSSQILNGTLNVNEVVSLADRFMDEVK